MSAPDLDDLLRRVEERAAAQKPAPPATEAELARAEESLGFALPPLLRRLYGEIGNGGFGPGSGWLPLFTPPQLRGPFPQGMVDLYHAYREEALEASLDDDGDDAPYPRLKHWRALRLPIADAGWPIQACVDSDRAELPVWYFEESEFRRAAPSLAEWLERWLNAPPPPPAPVRPFVPPRPPKFSEEETRAFLQQLVKTPYPKPPTSPPPPAAAPDPGALVSWFILQRVEALRREARFSGADTRETLIRETASMFGLTHEAALAQVNKTLSL